MTLILSIVMVMSDQIPKRIESTALLPHGICSQALKKKVEAESSGLNALLHSRALLIQLRQLIESLCQCRFH